MLNRRESEIMRAVYGLCEGKESCLVSVYEILSMLPGRRGYTAEAVEEILHSLELDDYFDLVSSERKGERMYVITLHRNGEAYRRDAQQMRRGIVFRIALSAVGAVVAFLVGLLLRTIFS